MGILGSLGMVGGGHNRHIRLIRRGGRVGIMGHNRLIRHGGG